MSSFQNQQAGDFPTGGSYSGTSASQGAQGSTGGSGTHVTTGGGTHQPPGGNGTHQPPGGSGGSTGGGTTSSGDTGDSGSSGGGGGRQGTWNTGPASQVPKPHQSTKTVTPKPQKPGPVYYPFPFEVHPPTPHHTIAYHHDDGYYAKPKLTKIQPVTTAETTPSITSVLPKTGPSIPNLAEIIKTVIQGIPVVPQYTNKVRYPTWDVGPFMVTTTAEASVVATGTDQWSLHYNSRNGVLTLTTGNQTIYQTPIYRANRTAVDIANRLRTLSFRPSDLVNTSLGFLGVTRSGVVLTPRAIGPVKTSIEFGPTGITVTTSADETLRKSHAPVGTDIDLTVTSTLTPRPQAGKPGRAPEPQGQPVWIAHRVPSLVTRLDRIQAAAARDITSALKNAAESLPPPSAFFPDIEAP